MNILDLRLKGTICVLYINDRAKYDLNFGTVDLLHDEDCLTRAVHRLSQVSHWILAFYKLYLSTEISPGSQF